MSEQLPPPAFEYEAPVLEGTIKPHPNFSEEHIEETIKEFQEAFKGLGADESAIIRILTQHNREQRMEIKKKYKAALGEDLIENLRDELSGKFEDLCVDLLLDTDHYHAQCLAEAMRDLGTNENWLVEILVPRTSDEMRRIRELYQKLYDHSLEDDVSEDTSGTFRRVLVSLIQGGRDQTEEVDQEAVKKDVEDLYNAGEGKFGTDDEVFNRIFALRSWAHLRAICEEYRLKAGRELLEVVDSEFCFDEKKAFMAIIKYAKDPLMYFTERLTEALHNDADDSLSRIIVAHSETDLKSLKERFQVKSAETLEDAIHRECRGDFRKLLLQICNPTLHS